MFNPSGFAGQFGGMGQSMAAGVGAGNAAGGQLSAAPVVGALGNRNLVLNPQEQATLMQGMANNAMRQQMQDASQQMGVSAGLANNAANLNATRQMALAAQANTAQNVANQLQMLGQARAANAGLIQGAMGTAAGMFR